MGTPNSPAPEVRESAPGAPGESPRFRGEAAFSPDLLQQRLVTVAERARALDIRDYEDQVLEVVVRGLVPRVGEALDRTTELFEHILDACDDPPLADLGGAEQDTDFYQAVDSVVATGEAIQHLADLAFMGRYELRSKRRQLAAVVERTAAGGERPWLRVPDRRAAAPGGRREAAGDHHETLAEIISLCGNCRRKILKVTTAIEHALCQPHGLEPQLDFVSELHASLRVRYACAKLRRAVLRGGEPAAAEIRGRLSSAGAAIARLIGRDAYYQMRYDDRRELRRLQRRLIEWMTHGPEADAEAGRRLWEDIAGFARLLDEINGRSELEDHDRGLVDEALGKLAAAPAARLSEELFRRVKGLYGCCEEIEELVDAESRSAADWRAALGRLRARLAVTAGAGRRESSTEDESP